jgi:hypothetical protein
MPVTEHDGAVVPCGARHTSLTYRITDDLKLYTIYSPPHHKDGIVRTSKRDAEANEEQFDGRTTEHLREYLNKVQNENL